MIKTKKFPRCFKAHRAGSQLDYCWVTPGHNGDYITPATRCKQTGQHVFYDPDQMH